MSDDFPSQPYSIRHLTPEEHKARIASAMQVLVDYLGRHEDLTDVDVANMEETPMRFAKAFMEMTNTRAEIKNTIKEVISTSFPAGRVLGHKPGIITQGPIQVVSLCPHHWLTVKYEVYVAYIPKENGAVLGLSKLARLAIALGKRPVLQEDLTKDIADVLHWEERTEKWEGVDLPLQPEWPHIKSTGSAVRVIGAHSCMSCRGVESNARTVTAELRGAFRHGRMEQKFDRFIEDCRRFVCY
jgi:GTP cyclohydrolase I